jgi:hypothetical protein
MHLVTEIDRELEPVKRSAPPFWMGYVILAAGVIAGLAAGYLVWGMRQC